MPASMKLLTTRSQCMTQTSRRGASPQSPHKRAFGLVWHQLCGAHVLSLRSVDCLRTRSVVSRPLHCACPPSSTRHVDLDDVAFDLVSRFDGRRRVDIVLGVRSSRAHASRRRSHERKVLFRGGTARQLLDGEERVGYRAQQIQERYTTKGDETNRHDTRQQNARTSTGEDAKAADSDSGTKEEDDERSKREHSVDTEHKTQRSETVHDQD